MDDMRSILQQIVCILLGLLNYSTAAPFILVLLLHLILKLARAVVLTLLLLLLELPEKLRRHWIRAIRPLHRSPPSTSRLLLLPPELRQQIWKILLEDFKCVEVRGVAPILYTSYVERLRLHMGINPEHSTTLFLMEPSPHRLQPHIAFIQSCRQIYNEAGYDLYRNKTFRFRQAKALVAWIRSLTPAQKRDVRRIHIIMLKDFYNHSAIAANSLIEDAVQVHFAMRELSGLRKLRITFRPSWPHGTKHEAQYVYQLIRNVKASEMLNVHLWEKRSIWDKAARWNVLRVRAWPTHDQEEFACAVWARICDPASALQQRVPGGEWPRAKFMLMLQDFKA